MRTAKQGERKKSLGLHARDPAHGTLAFASHISLRDLYSFPFLVPSSLRVSFGEILLCRCISQVQFR